MRTFFLVRDEDPTGISGVGVVAEGVVFSDMTVVLRWFTKTRSTGFYDSIGDVEQIHGHGGRTRIVMKEP